MKALVILSAAAGLVASGCSYALSPEAVRSADRTIPIEKLLADSAPYAGKVVILGGVIVQTAVTKNGTLIELMQKDLDYWGKPQRVRRSGGSFLALHRAALDGMVYAPGREVTLAAEVTGAEERFPAAAGITLPLLRVRELKLWPAYQSSWERKEWLDPLHDRSAPINSGY